MQADILTAHHDGLVERVLQAAHQGPTACSSLTATTTTSSLRRPGPTVSSARSTEVSRRTSSHSTVLPVV